MKSTDIHLYKSSHERHPKWSSVRDAFLKGKVCASCKGDKNLRVHHIIPFQIAPSLELDPRNLIVLCEGKKTMNCHLIVGHGGDFKDVNPYSKQTAKLMTWLLTGKQFIKGNVYTSDPDLRRRFGWFLRGLR